MSKNFPRIRFIDRQNPYHGRWSRTIGALGGQAVWERLTALPMAVIGCGRTGSLVAGNLARLGVRKSLLIDPDRIEAYNLGEMDAVVDRDLGRPKAEAMAEYLRASLSAAEITLEPLVATLNDRLAWQAVKSCRVLFACADNDAARLTAAILAALYHQVLIDIGTGIFFEGEASSGQRRRVMGADVRLIVPGDGCLLCHGHLNRYAQAVETLIGSGGSAMPDSDWRTQRTGSLRSLNQIAAGLGVHLLQDLVADRIQGSIWARIDFDETGRLAVSYPPLNRDPACRLCARMGQGDLMFATT